MSFPPEGAEPVELTLDDIDPTDPADLDRAADHLLATRAYGFESSAGDPAFGHYPSGSADVPMVRAVGDLHANSRGNREAVAGIRPGHPEDWLIVCGDVAERLADIVDVLATLATRFAHVIWVPGNHELWGGRTGLDELAAPARYELLVAACRRLGVSTPEDPFPVWRGAGGPVALVPLFLLYDYSWRPDPAEPVARALQTARANRVVATDEYLIDPHPYPSVSDWCHDRLDRSTRRLAELDPALPTVLINHWPLAREATRALRFPDFAMWCGTAHTEHWPARYNAQTCVYGHLHIPRSHVVDGVRHEEVSLGYPREWARRGHPVPLARQIVPVPAAPPVRWLTDDDGRPRLGAPGDSGTPFAADTADTDWPLVAP